MLEIVNRVMRVHNDNFNFIELTVEIKIESTTHFARNFWIPIFFK